MSTYDVLTLPAKRVKLFDQIIIEGVAHHISSVQKVLIKGRKELHIWGDALDGSGDQLYLKALKNDRVRIMRPLGS